MAHLHPSKGGCWFCHEDDTNECLYFDCEFDTYVHKSCIKYELSIDPASVNYNPEAEIMKYLLEGTNEQED